MNTTPNSNRLYISIFGRTNVGKSTLLNALTGQYSAIVSNTPGTTTDPVNKPIEINGLGACVITDTAGFDDITSLASERINKTEIVLDKTDIAVVLFNDSDITIESEWIKKLQKRTIPFLACITKKDLGENKELYEKIKTQFGVTPLYFSASDEVLKENLIKKLISLVPEDFGTQSITAKLVSENEHVLLVMPQDLQAPKGRLILPQVQTIRDLLDNKCIVTSCTLTSLEKALSLSKEPPSLIITDSQIFKEVYEMKSEKSRLTSFSVLFAQYKGDINEFISGANALNSLGEHAKILIAESCTHVPLGEDIGRVKIPALLKKRLGNNITIDNVSGTDFPKNLKKYDLIVHCGACMFNRKFVCSRIALAKQANVPITNYGVLIAFLSGILEKIEY